MRKFLAILFGILFISFTFAQDLEISKDGYTITNIEVANNREIPEEIITSLMETKNGDKFLTENLLKDYNTLKSQEYIDSVVIYPTIVEGGMKLTVNVIEKKDTKKLLQDKGIIPNSERETVDSTLVVSNIVINGLVNVSKKEVLEKLPVKVGAHFSEKRVVNGQRTFGEIGKFNSVNYQIVENNKGVTVVYNVVENPILNGINIVGNTLYSTEELLALISTKPGEVFSINTIREDREKILNKYYTDGHILADMIDVDINNNIELEFTITEGTVREVTPKKMITKVKGERRRPTDDVLKTKDFVIEREVEIKKSEVFNVKDYDETSANLMRTGLFKNVKYEANDIPGDSEGKSMVLLLEEERTASLQGAISYGSEVGLLGMVALKEDNWMGKGQKASIQYEKSNEGYSSFSINFQDPWIRGTNRLSWGWSLYKTDSELDDSELFEKISTYGGKINVGKGLSKYVRIGLGTKAEYIEEKGSDDYNGGSLTDAYGLWSIYPYITYDTRNNPMNPTKGEYAKYQVEGGYAGGYDADTFANTTLELRKYHKGFTKRNTMAYRVVSGIMTDTTKESQRFWVGGNNLRGYDGGFFQGTQKVVGTVEN
ncbi:MAG: BamA/OMP85 family outer membrane protein, partial [Fusobacteriaceae bacterium]